MATAADLPELDDPIERSKAVTKYLDADQRVPSNANHDQELLGWVYTYPSQWWSGLSQLNRPIIQDPEFDESQVVAGSKDPRGLFELVYEDDPTEKVDNTKKRNLASRLKIQFMREPPQRHIAAHEALTLPTEANNNAGREKERLAERGKAKANEMYRDDDPPNGEARGQGRGRRNQPQP